jgi:hypothetical protein
VKSGENGGREGESGEMCEKGDEKMEMGIKSVGIIGKRIS